MKVWDETKIKEFQAKQQKYSNLEIRVFRSLKFTYNYVHHDAWPK